LRFPALGILGGGGRGEGFEEGKSSKNAKAVVNFLRETIKNLRFLMVSLKKLTTALAFLILFSSATPLPLKARTEDQSGAVSHEPA